MGYRSDFQLFVESSIVPLDPQGLQKDLEEITGYGWDHDTWGGVPTGSSFSLYDVKWYEAENDMAELSLKYPDVRFSVQATGEDNGQWIIDAFGGKSDLRDGEVIFEERTLWS